MRRPLVAGNWKMHRTPREARPLARDVREAVGRLPEGPGRMSPEVVIFPPFPALLAVAEEIRGSRLGLGAQNLFWEKEGAFTGEVSGPMLRDAGVTMVIVGHSERRQHFGETDEQVAKKVRAALGSGLTAVMCLGETLEERERGENETVVKRQFEGAVAGMAPGDWDQVVIAYEPVWAIGTGRHATPAEAARMHAFLRALVRERAGRERADSQRILYGGSVNAENAPSLLTQEEIDGVLVGGASLAAPSFASIVQSAAGRKTG